MKIHTRFLVGVMMLTTLCTGSPLWSQDDPNTARRFLAELVGNARYDAYQQSSEGSPSETEGVQDPTITLEAGQANGKGTISWRPNEDCNVTQACWALKLTAPTDSSSEITDFVTLDGLAKDLVGGFDLRRPLLGRGGPEAFFATLDELCDALGFDSGCGDDTIAKKVRDTSNADLIEDLKDRGIDGEQLLAARRLLRRSTSAFFARGRVSFNQYEFFTLDSVKNKSDEFGSSFELGFSRVAGASGRLTFSITAQRAYEEQETKARACDEVGGSEGLESCTELPLGAPAEIDSLIAQMEYTRHVCDLALRPLVSYDFDQDVLALDLPIYLLRDDKGAFTGGFRVGWRSDTDEPVASIFVSKPLVWR
jgi:hypothetical protein